MSLVLSPRYVLNQENCRHSVRRWGGGEGQCAYRATRGFKVALDDGRTFRCGLCKRHSRYADLPGTWAVWLHADVVSVERIPRREAVEQYGFTPGPADLGGER